MLEVRIVSMRVDNEFGVLTRITALIRREGWNIMSLSVAQTVKPSVSRLTLAVACREATLQPALERLRRLDCVKTVALCEAGREMAVASVPHDCPVPEGSRVVERGDKLTLEFSGTAGAVDAWVERLAARGIADIARSGVVALS